MLIHGLNVGICFFIRANLVAMWIPIPIIICTSMLIKKKYVNLWHNILAGFIGLLLSFVPILLYGMYFDCLDDIYFGMLGFNFLYVTDKTINVSQVLFNPAGIILIGLMFSIVLILQKKVNLDVEVKLIMICSIPISVYFIFKSGHMYGHYYQYFVPFLYPIVLSA